MSDIVKPAVISVEVSIDDLAIESIDFHKDLPAFNQYINEMGAGDKIKPSFNYLMRCVVDQHKEALKRLIVVDNTPNGMAVMNIVGIVAEEMSAGVKFAVKKPKK